MPATAPPARGQEDTKELLLLSFLLPPSSDLPSPSLFSSGKTAGPPALPFCLSLIHRHQGSPGKGSEKPSLAEHHTRLQGDGGLAGAAGIRD